jgi:hypothetical protein
LVKAKPDATIYIHFSDSIELVMRDILADLYERITVVVCTAKRDSGGMVDSPILVVGALVLGCG